MLGAAAWAAAEVTFTGVGHLPSFQPSTVPLAVSADGRVTVGVAQTILGFEAFRFSPETGIADLGASDEVFAVRAADVSADGSTIIGDGVGLSGSIAFLWTAEGGLRTLPYQEGQPIPQSARRLSRDGAIAAGQLFTFGEVFRWTEAEGVVGLGFSLRSPAAMSDDGAVIAGFSNTLQASWWVDGQLFAPTTILGTLEPTAVSADGAWIVGTRTGVGADQAFRWDSSQDTVFEPIPGLSGALGMSGDGSVIVGYACGECLLEPHRAAIWDSAHGARRIEEVLASAGIDLSGWTLFTAEDVSDDGRTVVGRGLDPDGLQEAWVAVLPEPAAWLADGAALAVLLAGSALGRRRGRSRPAHSTTSA
jgi:uncharacterized membrane protein